MDKTIRLTKELEIDVNKRLFFDKHKIIYHNRITNSSDGIIFGTGKIGVIMWHTNTGVAMQINNVEASPQTQISSGVINIDSACLVGEVVSSIDFYDGCISMDFFSGAKIQATAGNKDSFFAIKISGLNNAECKVYFDKYDPVGFGNYVHRYFGYLKNYDDWKHFESSNGKDYIAISKNSKSDSSKPGGDNICDISDETIFGNILAIKPNLKCVLGDNSVCFNQNCELYIANPSKFESATVEHILDNIVDYSNIYNTNKLFWNDYFNSTFVSINTSSGDYLENFYYISQYILACGMSGHIPMHFISGVFRSQKDENLNWAPAYWWYNQRCLYNGMNSSGHSQNIIAMIDLYYNNIVRFKADTRLKYPQSEGFIAPETCGWDGNRFWTDNVDIVETIHASSIEIALMMYDYYLYTNDKTVLEKFCEFGKGVADFYCSVLLQKNESGKYYIPKGKSNARESFVQIENPICDIAGIKALFPILYKETHQNKYQQVVINLVDFCKGKFPLRLLAGANEIDYQRRNVDEPTLEALYPFNLSTLGDNLQDLLKYNYEYRIGRNQVCKFISWDNSAIWAARLGLGDDVVNFNIANIALTQKFANGLGTDGNCVCEYNGNMITSVNESLLQSHGGKITVFPAVPKSLDGFDPMFTLLARGGFLVTAEFDFVEMVTKYILIESKFGNSCAVTNVWNDNVEVYCNKSLTYTTNADIIVFDTTKNQKYFIKRKRDEFVFSKFDGYTSFEKQLSYQNKKVRLGN